MHDEETTDFNDYPNPYDFATQAEWQEAMRKVNETRRSQMTVGEATADEIEKTVSAERARCWDVVVDVLSNEGWLGRSWQLIEKGIKNG